MEPDLPGQFDRDEPLDGQAAGRGDEGGRARRRRGGGARRARARPSAVSVPCFMVGLPFPELRSPGRPGRPARPGDPRPDHREMGPNMSMEVFVGPAESSGSSHSSSLMARMAVRRRSRFVANSSLSTAAGVPRAARTWRSLNASRPSGGTSFQAPPAAWCSRGRRLHREPARDMGDVVGQRPVGVRRAGPVLVRDGRHRVASNWASTEASSRQKRAIAAGSSARPAAGQARTGRSGPGGREGRSAHGSRTREVVDGVAVEDHVDPAPRGVARGSSAGGEPPRDREQSRHGRPSRDARSAAGASVGEQRPPPLVERSKSPPS